LREPDPRVVTAAVGALGRLGPRASEAAGVLRDLLRESESGEVRMQALAALRRITLDDRAAFFADLIRALGDRDSRVREAALAQAEEIGCDHAGPEAAALLAALKAGARSRGLDDDRVFRIVQRMRDWRAADVPLLLDIRRRSEDELLADEVRATLVGLARADASAVPPLVEALAVPRLRRWAISVLWDVGPNARAAAPFLRRIAESGAPEEQVAAAEALDAVEQEQSAKERGGPVKERR
jgi:HEAT repeat protein